ncbi:hypothetical protein Patl1_34893 [Pistacia atlantica]|uniref:Uncharacterized protein n=1 Tax=Pistacia atlantica TaxID=434234 RepID=A0ACC0ZVC7_9ROSI|nr:hypothetical protein Patl1_34893 [Pistacia atlantica]
MRVDDNGSFSAILKVDLTHQKGFSLQVGLILLVVEV